MKDVFEILGIEEAADDAAIEKAYQVMVDKYPADRFPEEHADVVAAYKCIMKAENRQSCLAYHRMSHSSKQAIVLAENAVKEGNYDGAVKLLERIIKTEPHSEHLNYLLGQTCMEAGKYAKAEKAFEKLTKKYPKDTNLLMHLANACMDNQNFSKAVKTAEYGYSLDKNNIDFVYCLADGYAPLQKYDRAMAVLQEALQNPEFENEAMGIWERTALLSFLLGDHPQCLESMEKLAELEMEEEDRIHIGETFLPFVDFYIDKQMYPEVTRAMSAIMKLMPDREDIVEYKRNIDRIVKLEPEFTLLEEDAAIPDALTGITGSTLFPAEASDMTEEQKEAYLMMNRYHILEECNEYLMPLRYMKNKYPGLYELNTEFFGAVQDPKQRKILKTKLQTQIHRYRDIYEDMLEEWDVLMEDGDGEDEEPQQPYVRTEERVGRNDPCPCGSGKKFKKCCGINSQGV